MSVCVCTFACIGCALGIPLSERQLNILSVDEFERHFRIYENGTYVVDVEHVTECIAYAHTTTLYYIASNEERNRNNKREGDSYTQLMNIYRNKINS